MSRATMLRMGALILAAAVGGIAQDRFDTEHGGKFRGFTKSHGEHIMNEFEGVPEVRSVRGRVLEKSTDIGLAGVIVELRGENPADHVRGVRTRADGRFRIDSIPEGTYMFKITRDGYQSVYGKLKVLKKAPRKNTLQIELKHGV